MLQQNTNTESSNYIPQTDYFTQFGRDVIDIREVIERYEELEMMEDDRDEDEQAEFSVIGNFLDEVKGYGGDEDWRGDWYPLFFIKDWYFTDYCEEFVKECGYINDDLPYFLQNAIDWDKVADEMKYDYSEVEIEGKTYFYR